VLGFNAETNDVRIGAMIPYQSTNNVSLYLRHIIISENHIKVTLSRKRNSIQAVVAARYNMTVFFQQSLNGFEEHFVIVYDKNGFTILHYVIPLQLRMVIVRENQVPMQYPVRGIFGVYEGKQTD